MDTKFKVGDIIALPSVAKPWKITSIEYEKTKPRWLGTKMITGFARDTYFYNVDKVGDVIHARWSKEYVENDYVLYTSLVRDNKLNDLGL
jgi:hypothetical protein